MPTLPLPLTNSNEVLPDDTCKGTCTPEPEMLTDPDTSSFAFGVVVPIPTVASRGYTFQQETVASHYLQRIIAQN
jgi:hypothetical protein